MPCRAALQDQLGSFCVGLLPEDTVNTVLSTRHNSLARVRSYDTPDNEVEMLRLILVLNATKILIAGEIQHNYV